MRRIKDARRRPRRGAGENRRERSVSRWTLGYLGLVGFSILGMAICRALGRDAGAISSVTAALTLVIGVTAVFRSMSRAIGARIVGALGGTVLLGAAVEVIGVSTGFPFGRYGYTDRWKPVVSLPSIGWFPVQLPLAWALMAGASTLVVVKMGRGGWPKWAYATIAGLLAAGIDVLMEPVMTGALGYWRWSAPGPLPGGAAAMNFFGWWLTAGIGAALLLALGARAAWRGNDAIWVLVGHVALLAGIALGGGAV